MLTNDLDRLPPETRAALVGPGSPFELVRADVRGVPMTVFANRPPHLPALLRDVAAQHPGRPYLVFPERRLTYAETVDRVGALASVLRDAHGVGRGDRVALVGANSLEYALTLWALAWLGAVSVSLNGWWTGSELDHGLALAQPKLLIGDEKQLARTSAQALTFADLRPGSSGIPVDPGLHEDDPVSILFTSGTTGRPKGAVITHRGLVNFAQDAQLRGYAESILSGATAPPPGPPVALVVSPFFHISGLGPLLGGGPYNGMTMVFPPRGRWDPLVHLELTERYGVTQWSGVPTQLVRLLRHPDLPRFDVSSVRTLGMGGAPITAELATLFGAVLPGARPAQGFGMSETCGQGTTIAGARMVANPQSIGLATPTSEVTIRDPLGTDVADGEIGEIAIRSPSGFLGYWNDPDATAAVLDEDGWYRTGDYGRVVDGMLQLESRLRDMIIRGGENIYPIEIENRLSEHPGLLDAAVIGVPHDELGQEVMAVVVGDGLTAADVREWVGRTLAPYKVPAHVRFVDALPYSATGKLLKRELEKRVLD
ncbi:class I adenylate-forming enzyme family protein [Cryptosporangium arvum]|uniref:class I adenylate-forming enzyme family protein n=1 Tax=Cryptosporangium arvum TaxID=80871 RepID=UPI0004BBFC15|nr:class I adenylate-forming enzyme family protein [Cryptosporangium arvum]